MTISRRISGPQAVVRCGATRLEVGEYLKGIPSKLNVALILGKCRNIKVTLVQSRIHNTMLCIFDLMYRFSWVSWPPVVGRCSETHLDMGECLWGTVYSRALGFHPGSL